MIVLYVVYFRSPNYLTHYFIQAFLSSEKTATMIDHNDKKKSAISDSFLNENS